MQSPTLDAVLPLTARDFERYEILRKSLDRFFPDLGVCWVVLADWEYDALRARIGGGRYRVIAESALIPELRFYNLVRVLVGRSHKPLDGWYSQQLRKLAIAGCVTSPFYLTLDADVICTRTARYADLIRNGRALGRKSEDDVHHDWYERAAQVLGVSCIPRWHNLTPGLLSREAVLMLQKHLAGRVHPALRLLSHPPAGELAPASLLGSWRSYLLRNLPWTEYSLYYTFLEALGLYDRYYFTDKSRRLEDPDHSVRQREKFAGWRPGHVPESEVKSFFSVVQSNLNIPASAVWEKVRPFLEGTPGEMSGAGGAVPAGTR
jgi:Family of unknown function (DUF6492)